MHEFEQLEQGALAALDPLKAKGLKTLELYAGQVEEEDVKELARMTARFPCIYLIAAGLNNKTRNRYDEKEVGIVLIVGDKNLRGTEAARHGDSRSPGVYELLSWSKDLLHRKKIAEGWAVAVLESETPLFLAPVKSVCFYSASYRIETVS